MCSSVKNVPVLYGDSKTEKKKWDYKKALLKALKERDLLLKKRPELFLFQKEIDNKLQNIESFEDRMEILGTMMGAKLNVLYDECFKLNAICNKNNIGNSVKFEILEKNRPDRFLP